MQMVSGGGNTFTCISTVKAASSKVKIAIDFNAEY
jgi:hypothetical protein